MQPKSTDPPKWQDAERPGRVSWLPSKQMTRAHKSELRRREFMAADEADWRRVQIDVVEFLRSEAALDYWSTAFAEFLTLTTEPVSTTANGERT